MNDGPNLPEPNDLPPMPFDGLGAYGNSTDPGVMTVLGLMLIGFAIATAWAIARRSDAPGWLWIGPVVLAASAVLPLYIAVAKLRWGREIERLTGKNPWKSR